MVVKYSFLHIGKTGGTALRDVISRHNRTRSATRVKYIGHDGSLKEIVEGDLTDRLIFFVRDPVSRFVSAFNSRLRKGRYNDRDWSQREEQAFAYFATANALGEALGSFNPLRRRRAERAVKAIAHLRRPLDKYLGPIDLLEREKRRIFYIGRQETLPSDFECLKALLEMDPALSLPSEEHRAHRAPDSMDRHLSPTATTNIRRYYAKDYPIYQWCLEYRDELLQRHISEHPDRLPLSGEML